MEFLTPVEGEVRMEFFISCRGQERMEFLTPLEGKEHMEFFISKT
jgi:hypothetical protein